MVVCGVCFGDWRLESFHQYFGFDVITALVLFSTAVKYKHTTIATELRLSFLLKSFSCFRRQPHPAPAAKH
jgi:hypothetical protein